MEEKKSFWKKPGVQTVLTSLICILFGLLVGYIVLLIINPAGATEAIRTIILSFLTRPTPQARLKALGNTLVKTAPLLMCALSVCFAYKVGLFNIGAAGQYEVGACACLLLALKYHMPWYVCMIGAAAAGALLGFISGALKAYRNVNEVISGIMLNWIFLYVTNSLLFDVKEDSSPYTETLNGDSAGALIPSLGLEKLFNNNRNVTIAIVLAVVCAILVWIVLEKTKFGYELKATGYNKEAARYAGMKEKRNIIITLVIAGAIAGLGASFMYQSGYMKWETTASSVPSMGFNGIAATFLGGLNPIGTIFASFFIQAITDGGSMIDRMIYPSQVSDLIAGIIIYLSGFVLFFKYLMNKPHKQHKKDEKKTATGGGTK